MCEVWKSQDVVKVDAPAAHLKDAPELRTKGSRDAYCNTLWASWIDKNVN